MKRCNKCGAIQNDSRHHCIDCGEKLGKPLVELTDAESLEDEETLEEMVLSDERKRIVHNAIEKLSDDMRVVIHLIYFEEMTYDEAGSFL